MVVTLKDKELLAEATISKMEIVQKGGKRKVSRNVEAYNLDMIISVGYRVNSTRATDFRKMPQLVRFLIMQ